MNPITVMIVDDHAVVRDGLRALLTTRPGIEVVGLAPDGVEAVHLAGQCNPDVVLMDLGMPRMDGVEATRRITTMRPAPAVIVLTMSDDDTSVLAAVRAGARGYLLKDADGDDVVAAIRAGAGGQAVFGQGVAGTVLGLLHSPPAQQDRPFTHLSHRELQVLELIAADLGNQAIGRRLGVSPKTVANTVSTILVKIGAPDRARAAATARAAGLGAPQQSRWTSGPIPGAQGMSALSPGKTASSDSV